MRQTVGIISMSMLLIAATPTPFGGWAVVTVRDLPEHMVVGTPTTLSFEIRQHGERLLDDRSPTVTLRRADAGLLSRMLKRDRFSAVKGPGAGLYQATVMPTDTGDLSVVIDTDLFGWKVRLLPMRVTPAETSLPPLAAHERGRQLFAATGCATCHLKRDDPALADWQVVAVGPPLTGRVFPADWLKQKLLDPAAFRGAALNGSTMPNLGLGEPEIEALVSYLNGDQLTMEISGRR